MSTLSPEKVESNSAIITPPLALAVEPLNGLYQTDFTAGSVNALQACVATLFGRSLETVPNFIALTCGYEKGIEQFVAPHFDMHKIVLLLNDAHEEHSRPSVPPNQLVILRGKSPRGTHGHVVIARSDHTNPSDPSVFVDVHDPHPEGTFLDPRERPAWCMVFTPRSSRVPLFFRLPRSWFVAFLSEWLSDCDVCRLDTAMTMHRHRPKFLQCLKEMRSTTVDTNNTMEIPGLGFERQRDLSVYRLLWVSRRQIHLPRCHLHGGAIGCQYQELKFPSLRELRLDYVGEIDAISVIKTCSEVRFVGINQMMCTDTLLHNIAQHCPLLETIDINFTLGVASLASKFADFISFFRQTQASHLKNIVIRGGCFPFFSDVDLEKLHEFGHLFVHMDVDFINIVSLSSDRGITRFVERCSRLATLHVLGARDDTFFRVFKSCRTCPLTTVVLDECYLGSLPSTAGALSFVGLTRLEVTNCNFPSSFYAAFGRLVNLEYLVIHYCRGVGEFILGEMAKGGLRLKELTIVCSESTTVHLTGAGFRSFVGAPICQSLEKLELQQDSTEVHLGVAEVLVLCPRLREFGVLRFGDKEIATICEGRRLQRLSIVGLDYVPALTMTGLMLLASTYTATLRSILLRNPHFSIDELALFRSHFPHIVLDHED